MPSETPLSPEVWERIPPEAQAYIGALEARVGALEETVQRLQAAGSILSRIDLGPARSK